MPPAVMATETLSSQETPIVIGLLIAPAWRQWRMAQVEM